MAQLDFKTPQATLKMLADGARGKRAARDGRPYRYSGVVLLILGAGLSSAAGL